MARDLTKNASRQAIWVAIFCIASLILISALPWISTAEKDAVHDDLFYNYEMMQKSSNLQIKNVANNLDIISMMLWTTIIFSLIAYIGIIIHISGKNKKQGFILMLFGISTLIISIIIVASQISLIQSIKDNDIFSSAVIYYPLNYDYLTLIFGLLTLISSVFYTWNVTQYSYYTLKGPIQQKIDRDKKIKNKKPSEKVSRWKMKKAQKKEKKIVGEIPLKPQSEDKREVMEDWLSNQVEDIEKHTADKKLIEPNNIEKEAMIELEPIPLMNQPDIQNEEQKEPVQIDSKIENPLKIDEKNRQGPFPPEKTIVKPKDSGQISLSQPFENALSSAIQKKQMEVGEQKPLKKDKKVGTKEKSSTKKFNVRCPQCKYVFAAEKKNGLTKIKCPSCGKEGVIG